jgi:hypothetical protein
MYAKNCRRILKDLGKFGKQSYFFRSSHIDICLFICHRLGQKEEEAKRLKAQTASSLQACIFMIIQTMILKEFSDSLIHTAPSSVSLVHHNFRNDVFGVIPQS